MILQNHIKDVLYLIFIENWRADRALLSVFQQNKSLIFSQRGEIASTVYDICRYWRLLWACNDQPPGFDTTSFTKLLDAWKLIRRQKKAQSELDSAILKRFHELQIVRRFRESVPDWLDEEGERQLEARWDSILAALNRPASQVLRTNTIKISPPELYKKLAALNIGLTPVSWAPEAWVLNEYTDIYHLQEFHQGMFEIQDAASQAVSHFMQVQPGMRVIDACAGNGGKSLHLAALMLNKGKIISLDVNAHKLDELSRRARRAGIHIIETRHVDTTKVIKRLQESADCVLLDVPCSGIGALRRNPEIKWRLQPTDIITLQTKQFSILSRYASMVKKGGLLVYASCSVLPSEGEVQANLFLSTHKDSFTLVEEKRLSPDIEGFDGFYIAALKKKQMLS